MLNNKPTVILTGAGAMIPWGAPSTLDITNAIRYEKTFKSYTEQPIGDWIYHQLKGLYHKDPEYINFETIVNALEYLVTFFYSKLRPSVRKFKNIMPAFLEESDKLWEILWFDRIYEKHKNDKSWFVNNKRYSFYGFWKDYDYFFENVFRLYINVIVRKVENYSTSANNKETLNKNLNEFLDYFKYPFRIYTTNYDRLIPNIYKGEIFEGFTEKNKELKFDLIKVLSDDNINSYYNLHGSVHYELDWSENVKYIPNKFIYDFGSGASDKTDQDSRKIINSNIITGYNKSSRILTTPYSQFYNKFSQDCISAEKIIIIGYSFGDIHINKAIKTASLVSENLKIEIITYDSEITDFDLRTEYDWVQPEGRWGNNFIGGNFRGSLYEGIVDILNIDRIWVYRKGFEQYLKEKQWTII